MSQIPAYYKETVKLLDRIGSPQSIQDKIDAMLMRQQSKSDYNLSQSFVCLAVLRYLVIHRQKAHIALCRRMVEKYDLLSVLIGLVEFRPWTRVDKATNARLNFKSTYNTWVPYSDDLPLSEACVWIMLVSMILGGDIDYNPQSALCLRKYITASMIEQIPFVDDLKHYLEQLNLMETMGQRRPRNASPKINLVSIVDVQETMYERFKREGVLHAIQKLSVPEEMECSNGILNVCKLALDTTNFDDVAYFPPKPSTQSSSGPVCCVCGVHGALHRCSKCKKATYCSRVCQVKDWPQHRPKC